MPRRGLRHPGSPAPSEIDAQPIDWQNPLARGLAAYWPTLLGAGNVIRGYGPLAGDMAAHNGAALSPDPVMGLAASNFDGTTSGRYWSSTLAWPGGPISVAFWMRIPNAGKHRSAFGAPKSGTSTGTPVLECHPCWSDGKLYWDYGDITGDGRISTDFAGRNLFNQWVSVCLTSGGNATPYMGISINGQLVASKSSSGNVTHTGPFDLGRWNDLDNFPYPMVGALADFRIYRRVLSPAEIWSLYAPQTRWQMLRARSTRRWFTPSTPPATGGFRLINGRQYRPGSLVA